MNKINGIHSHTYVCMYIYVCSARNNSQPLAIFRPFSAFGRPKSILVSQISCTFSMGTAISYLKKIHFQKTADQFLILISSTAYVHTYNPEHQKLLAIQHWYYYRTKLQVHGAHRCKIVYFQKCVIMSDCHRQITFMYVYVYGI